MRISRNNLTSSMWKVGLLAFIVISMVFILPGSDADDENGVNALQKHLPWGGLLNGGFKNIRIKYSHKSSSKSSTKTTKHTFHHYTGKK